MKLFLIVLLLFGIISLIFLQGCGTIIRKEIKIDDEFRDVEISLEELTKYINDNITGEKKIWLLAKVEEVRQKIGNIKIKLQTYLSDKVLTFKEINSILDSVLSMVKPKPSNK
jgi:CHASE3 domain sensor protein